MFSVLLYLRLTTLKNMAFARARRLRQPKYFAAALVVAAYFYFFLYRRVNPILGGPGGPPGVISGSMLFAAFGIFIYVVWRQVLTWISPSDRPGLQFSEAEIAFLFPAPISRRALIHYNLLSSQFSTFFYSLLMSALSWRWHILGGHVALQALGWWMLFSTRDLHLAATTLTVNRLIERGIDAARRRAIIFGIVALYLAALWLSVERAGPMPAGSADFSTWAAYGYNLLDSGPLHWLLWPFKLLLGPFRAVNGREFYAAAGPAMLLLAAHYLWVLQLEAPIEEGSIALAQKRAQFRHARQAGRTNPFRPLRARSEPFRLVDHGRPEWAFLWKNLLSIRAAFSLRVVALAAILFAAPLVQLRFALIARAGHTYADLSPVVLAGALMLAFFTLFLGPQWARQDLRHDLGNADILKTYPLAGWQVVLGEMLTPAAILTALLWCALLAAAWGFVPHGPSPAGWLTPRARMTVTLGLAVVAPPLCLLQLIVPNAAALLFPAWFQATRSRSGGIEVAGQRLIFRIGQLLVVAVALLPAAAAAALVFFSTQWLLGLDSALALALAAVVVLICAEVVLGVLWLGKRFERFDLSTS